MNKTHDKYFIFDAPRACTPGAQIKSTVTKAKNLVYKGMMNAFPPPASDKQYTVALCAIFKNEAPYLKEWVEFHQIVGVEHFYMYNNNSEDNYLSVLQPYIDSGFVTLVQWPHNQAQMECYKDCIQNFSSQTRWLGFIDLDEFVVPKTTDDIYSFLKPFEKNRGSVLIYWKLFGTSGKFDRNRSGLVTEDFTVCWKKYCDIGKCFYNTRYAFDGSSPNNAGLHHRFWAKLKGKNIPPVNIFDKVCNGPHHIATQSDFPIQINHYFTKSYMEYAEKRAKGDVYFKINPHDEAYFYEHEMKCIDTDYSAYKYLIRLKSNLQNK